MRIRQYEARDEASVIALWEECGLTRPWNDPRKDIARKLKVDPELFVLAHRDDDVIATAMGGYEGHRGWINYLAVRPDSQRMGVGRALMTHLEQKLRERGCPKINIQIRASNLAATGFYNALGYVSDEVVSMGKRLERDD